MWIAIAYERCTTVITWNLTPTEEQAIAWVIDSLYPQDMSAPDSDADALATIDAVGYDVQIEKIDHLETSGEFAIRLPNEFTIKRTADYEEAVRNQRHHDQKLREAGSPERVTVVSRHAVHTRWQEVQ